MTIPQFHSAQPALAVLAAALIAAGALAPPAALAQTGGPTAPPAAEATPAAPPVTPPAAEAQPPAVQSEDAESPGPQGCRLRNQKLELIV